MHFVNFFFEKGIHSNDTSYIHHARRSSSERFTQFLPSNYNGEVTKLS